MKTHTKLYIECLRKDWLYLRSLVRQSKKFNLIQYQAGDQRECEKARIRYLAAIRENQ